jgi:hypothetical protein
MLGDRAGGAALADHKQLVRLEDYALHGAFIADFHSNEGNAQRRRDSVE